MNTAYDRLETADAQKVNPARIRTLARLVLLLLCAMLLGACATTPATPEPIDPENAYSFQTLSKAGLDVSVAILTDDEARRHFGVDLGSKDVQALWIRVRNQSNWRYWFIRNGVDPDLYSADEAALLMENEVSNQQFDNLRQYFRDESIRVALEPGLATQGYLFLPREEGGRYVEIRLVADAYALAENDEADHSDVLLKPDDPRVDLKFEYALFLPDGEFDFELLDVEQIYSGRDLPDLDTGELRRELAALPCCVFNKDGDREGDPLNIVLIGGANEVMSTLSRAGWSFTHRITAGTVRRLVAAALDGEGYAVAPVSSLYQFGRKQDIALQRARRNIAQRNHMRLWLAPFRYRGRSVWVGQISRDIGIKMSTKSPSLTTHVIDPEIDLTREYLLHSLIAEGFVKQLGFVEGSRSATRENPATNLTDDPYFSDGLRLVVELSTEPVRYQEVRSLSWEQSGAPMAEGQSEAAERNVWQIEAEKQNGGSP